MTSRLPELQYVWSVAVTLPDGVVVVLPATGVVRSFLSTGIVLAVRGAVPGWPEYAVAIEFTHGRFADVFGGGGAAGVLVFAAEAGDTAARAIAQAHDLDGRRAVAEVELRRA